MYVGVIFVCMRFFSCTYMIVRSYIGGFVFVCRLNCSALHVMFFLLYATFFLATSMLCFVCRLVVFRMQVLFLSCAGVSFFRMHVFFFF